VNHPPLLLADEPTGNLDSRSGVEILKILTGLNEQGVTIIDRDAMTRTLLPSASEIISMKDGKITADEVRP